MADNEDDDASVIVLTDESSSPEGSVYPDLQIRLTPSPLKDNDCEIKQAHTALTTAYNSLKTKLNKVEHENKGLKALLRKRRPHSMAFNNTGTGNHVGEEVKSPPVVSHNSILRRHSARLVDDNQHKRHGSWAHFNDVSSPNDDQYAKFLEMQIESTEKTKNVLKIELEQLRLRYTDHEMTSNKLKQDLTRLEKENQQLRSEMINSQHMPRNRSSEHEEIEELKKMNICLQNQLKNAVEDYDRSCVVNKQLEERLQYKIDQQERQRADKNETMNNYRLHSSGEGGPRYDSRGEGGPRYDSQGREMGLLKSMLNMTSSLDASFDSDDMSNLHQAIRLVQQQSSELKRFKESAKQQNVVIAELQQKLSCLMKSGGNRSSPSVTLDRPITCVDDLETRKLSPSSSLDSFHNNNLVHLINNIKQTKIPSQNSDNELTTDQDSSYIPPTVQDTSYILPTLQDPVFTPPGLNQQIYTPQMVAVGGETSDGVVGGNTEGPETMTILYDESADFTIHHSDEGQTLVKHIPPSTMLQLQQQAAKNRVMSSTHNDNSGTTPKTKAISSTPSTNDNYGNTPKTKQQIFNQDNVTIPKVRQDNLSNNAVPNPHIRVLSNNVRYPNVPLHYKPQTGSAGSSDEEVFDYKNVGGKLNLSDNVLRQGRMDQYINPNRLSQSEHLGRKTTHVGPPQTITAPIESPRTRHGSQTITAPVESPRTRHSPQTITSPQGYGYNNSHDTRCGQTPTGREPLLLSPRTSDSSNQYTNGLVNPVHSPINSLENRYRGGAQGVAPRPLNIDRNIVTKDLHPKSYDNRVDNVNINTGQVRDKLPTGSSVSRVTNQYLTNDPVLGTLSQQKPVAAQNLNSTYLTVKLPPVENSEELSDNTSDMRACPICSYIFPVHDQQQQSTYEKHVEDCMRDFEHHSSDETEYRKCPMCDSKFEINNMDQETFERHVQSHFDGNEDPTDRFELLNF